MKTKKGQLIGLTINGRYIPVTGTIILQTTQTPAKKIDAGSEIKFSKNAFKSLKS